MNNLTNGEIIALLVYFAFLGICIVPLAMGHIITRVQAKIENKKKYVTFTKRWFGIILKHSIVWVYLSYILAFMGKEQIAETLSITAVTTILGAFITYAIKSFGEKKIGKEKEENEENNTEVYQ